MVVQANLTTKYSFLLFQRVIDNEHIHGQICNLVLVKEGIVIPSTIIHNLEPLIMNINSALSNQLLKIHNLEELIRVL